MIIDSEKINQIDIGFDMKKDKKYYYFMAKRDRVDFIYNTSALEGNAMTYPEVQTLLEGITVGGHKLSDEQMILNQNDSLKLLFDMIEEKNFRINKKSLCRLHSKVSYREALIWGDFRDGNVNIGGTEYQPPHFDKLNEIFKNGILEIKKIKNPIVKAFSYFLFGAKNQFFYDGNKRVSRLMMNGILLDSGYPIMNIKAKDRVEFNRKMVEFYDGEAIEVILNYLLSYYKIQNQNLGRKARRQN